MAICITIKNKFFCGRLSEQNAPKFERLFIKYLKLMQLGRLIFNLMESNSVYTKKFIVVPMARSRCVALAEAADSRGCF